LFQIKRAAQFPDTALTSMERENSGKRFQLADERFSVATFQ